MEKNHSLFLECVGVSPVDLKEKLDVFIDELIASGSIVNASFSGPSPLSAIDHLAMYRKMLLMCLFQQWLGVDLTKGQVLHHTNERALKALEDSHQDIPQTVQSAMSISFDNSSEEPPFNFVRSSSAEGVPCMTGENESVNEDEVNSSSFDASYDSSSVDDDLPLVQFAAKYKAKSSNGRLQVPKNDMPTQQNTGGHVKKRVQHNKIKREGKEDDATDVEAEFIESLVFPVCLFVTMLFLTSIMQIVLFFMKI